MTLCDVYPVQDSNQPRHLLQVLSARPVCRADLSPAQHLCASFFAVCHAQLASSAMEIVLTNLGMVLPSVVNALNSQNSLNWLLSLGGGVTANIPCVSFPHCQQWFPQMCCRTVPSGPSSGCWPGAEALLALLGEQQLSSPVLPSPE